MRTRERAGGEIQDGRKGVKGGGRWGGCGVVIRREGEEKGAYGTFRAEGRERRN